jgi:Iap family predicted aminopeptidase
MDGFARRHFGELPLERTAFINVDQVGDQYLNLLCAEGPVKMRSYSSSLIALLEAAASDRDVEVRFPNLRGRTGGDGQLPLKAGYPTAYLQSLTEHKLQSGYHWPTDTPEKVNYGTVAAAVEVCEAAVRRLDANWLAVEAGKAPA